MPRKSGSSNFLLLVLIILVAVFMYFDKPWKQKATSTQDVNAAIEKYISDNPKAILDSVQRYQVELQRQKGEQATKSIKDKLGEVESTKISPFVGNPNGDVIIVEYFDYNCGYCKKAFPDLKKLVDEDKNVKVVFKEFPIFGPSSELPAKAALAVHKLDKTKYFAFHGALMNFQGQKTEEVLMDQVKKVGLDPVKVKEMMNGPEVAAILAKEKELGTSIGVQGTPAFIIAGEFVPGALPYEALKDKVKQAREKGGKKEEPKKEPVKKEEDVEAPPAE